MVSRYTLYTPLYGGRTELLDDPNGDLLRLGEILPLLTTLRVLVRNSGIESRYINDALNQLLGEDTDNAQQQETE